MARKAPDPTKRIYKGPAAQLGSMAWSDDGRFIVAGDWKGNVTLWGVDDTKPRWSTNVSTSRTVAVGFDRDRVLATEVTGRLMALARDDGHVLGGAADLATVNGHNVLFAGDGRVVFRGVDKAGRWTVTAVDAERFEVAWERAGDVFFAGAEAGVVYLAESEGRGLWVLRGVDLGTGAEVFARPTGAWWAYAVHAASNTVAVSNFNAIQFRRLDAPGEEGPAASLYTSGGGGSGAFSPDGRWLAVLQYNHVGFIEVATTALTMSTTKHTPTASALAWSRDGRTLLSAGWDRVVRVHAVPAAI